MSNSESEEEIIQQTPPELREEATAAAQGLLPAKSKYKYEAAYNVFLEWKKENKGITSENCLLVYFKKYMEKYKPSTVWSHYSMVKSMIKLKEKIDIGEYHMLSANMKNNGKGFQSKKSRVFTGDQLKKFLDNAPDEIYLSKKVIIIFGVMGCCRSDEITNVSIVDVKQEGQMFVVSIPNTKTQVQRKFTIDSQFYELVKKYMSSRPANCTTQRFFLQYLNQKCTKQPIGKNTIASVPKEIANYLQLEDANLYTGHALRRTSATLLSNAGGTMMDLKHLGGWQSDRVAQGYVEDSLLNKTRISSLVATSISGESKEIKTTKEKSSSPKREKDNSDLQNLSPPLKKFKTDPEDSSTASHNPNQKMIYINNCTVTINQ